MVKGRQGLEVPDKILLKVLRLRPGVGMTTAEILKAVKEDPDDFDNRASITASCVYLEERGKVKSDWDDTGSARRQIWLVEIPKEPAPQR